MNLLIVVLLIVLILVLALILNELIELKKLFLMIISVEDQSLSNNEENIGKTEETDTP